MSDVILGKALIYGIPDELPWIPGFDIIADAKNWLFAQKIGKPEQLYIIEETNATWLLSPIIERSEKSTMADFSKTITVKKPTR